MPAYYNEIDPFAAQWLRNLIAAGHIAPGDVDERDIRDVRADDLKGYSQCHFFAGIGGWSYALRLAGWGDERPVWTGSCPCQPFSSAARGRAFGTDDPRDLWPAWFRIIAASRPGTIFGEQIAHKSSWIDRASDDLETLDYEIGAALLQAVSVGADHARPRIYFVGNTDGNRESSVCLNGEMARLQRNRSDAASVVPAHGLPDRVAIFSGFGNAIHAELAAQFIGAYCDAVT